MLHSFYINDRFFVDPAASLLRDEQENIETRLEPRLLQVLCVLVEKNGVTAAREELVRIVWKDYGGGDEGLTQAISTLRKLLADTQKELIQTIPKKGYLFRGEVSPTRQACRTEPDQVFTPKEKIGKVRVAFLFFFVVLTTVLYVVFKNSDRGSKKTEDAPTQVLFPGMQPNSDSAHENKANTIITKGPDSSVYKLVMIGDEQPRFFINNQELPVHQWEPYQPLINNLKGQLQKRNE
jgi:DNA-binding winged helix-turn-helix (wHTH) protein